MKNLIAVNFPKNSKKTQELELITKVQIENSLELGWNKKDLIVISNEDFEFMEVKSKKIEMNKKCLTGSKMYAIRDIFLNGEVQTVWSHDLDSFQNYWFDEPDIKDVGACEYSQPKFNGGSIFWKPSSLDIINQIIYLIELNKEDKEEPTINKVFKSSPYRNRVTVLNYTYNVGCSGYTKRYHNSTKPIKVSHLHPTNRIAWETHCLDRNGTGYLSVSHRLEKLIRKYYPNLATELAEDGKKKRLMNIEKIKNGTFSYD